MRSRFQFVAEHHPAYSVKQLCLVLGVNRPSYRKWPVATSAPAGRSMTSCWR